MTTTSLTRAEWMGLLAQSPGRRIASLAGALPPHRRVRGPEFGLVMLRGRAGGEGTAFNLGEATATRCTVALAGGMLGHAWRLGRDAAAAECSAVLDALLQGPDAAAWETRVLAPLRTAREAGVARDARRAAATAVRFATLGAMR